MTTPPPPRWAEGLSGATRRIAESTASPLRVLAGPGTGKTFALMRRVMRHLENGMAAKKILVCTFTRTAARDLQSEIAKLGVAGADTVAAGTVHALCFSLLARAEVLPLTGRVPRPLLGFEERFLLEDLVGTNGEGIRALGKRFAAFSAAWARLQSDVAGWPPSPEDQAFLAALLTWLREHEGMLIGELVPETLRFLRDNPASPVRPSFESVLVDEYQDLNRAEQSLLELLAGKAGFTVIGDEDQSIYSFKHAHPEGIARFKDRHPTTHDESLDECRRCPKVVVAMANSLVACNPDRAQRSLKELTSVPAGEVHVVQWPSLDEEAAGLARFVQRRVSGGGVSAGKTLILAPRRQIGYGIRDALNAAGVPAHSFFQEELLDGDPKDAEACTVQEAFAILTALAHPSDLVARRCWAGFGSPSLRKGPWRALREHSRTNKAALPDILEQFRQGSVSIPRGAELRSRLQALEDRLQTLRELTGRDLVDAIFPSDADWAGAIREVLANIEDDAVASDIHDKLRTSISQPELPADVDYVRIMSLHKSKGLTADLVVVAGCIQGLIPTIPHDGPAAAKDAALREQRRLFYVALTRARQTLVLSSVSKLEANVAYKMGARVAGGRRRRSLSTIASQFLSELGPTRPATLTGAHFLTQVAP